MEALAPVLEVVNNYPYLSSASVIIGCAALVRLARLHTRSRLPPGPRGYPIVGNLFDLSSTHVWKQFGTWGKQYGELTSFYPSHDTHFHVNIDSLNLARARTRHAHQRFRPGHDNTQFVESRL